MVTSKNVSQANIHSDIYGTRNPSYHFARSTRDAHAAMPKQLRKSRTRSRSWKHQRNPTWVIYATILHLEHFALHVTRTSVQGRTLEDISARASAMNGWLHVMIFGLILVLILTRRCLYAIHNQKMKIVCMSKITPLLLKNFVKQWALKFLL